MYPEIKAYLESLQPELNYISSERIQVLDRLAEYINEKLSTTGSVDLIFICTHNSRRSHLAQIWAAVTAEFMGIKGIRTWSGGTEATAFNPNAIGALERKGFKIEGTNFSNPHYRVYYGNGFPLVCYSKRFDDPENPQTGFAAIMTCSEADENCPFVPGAEFRIPVTYRDPKEADGSDLEASTYDERSHQISLEMLYVISKVQSTNPVN